MDISVILFFRDAVASAPWIDIWAEFIAGNALLKGVVPGAMIWILWCRPDPDQQERRTRLLAVLALAVVAIVLGRALSVLLPFNARPLHDPQFDQSLFYEAIRNNLNTWSSFPSDHAVLFFALATAMLFVNRTAGILLIIHAAIVISLPRVIVGYHWPTDIYGGAAVGIVSAVLLFKPILMCVRAVATALRLDTHGPWATAFLFVATYEVSSMFVASRELVSFLAKIGGLWG